MNPSWLAVVLCALLLSGCSGDGGSASTPPPTQPPPTQPPPTQPPPIDPTVSVPLRTAVANIVQQGFNQPFTVSGSIEDLDPNPIPPTPLTGTGRFVLEPASPATLCAFPVQAGAQTITGERIANGVSTPLNSTSTIYYRDDNTIVGTSPPEELFVHDFYTYPDTIKAGESGQIGTGTQVNDNCTNSLPASTITGHYFATADSASSLLVTFVYNRKIVGGDAETRTVYRMATTGDVALVSITSVQTEPRDARQTMTFSFV